MGRDELAAGLRAASDDRRQWKTMEDDDAVELAIADSSDRLPPSSTGFYPLPGDSSARLRARPDGPVNLDRPRSISSTLAQYRAVSAELLDNMPRARIRNLRACGCDGANSTVGGYSCLEQAGWGKCAAYEEVMRDYLRAPAQERSHVLLPLLSAPF